jgi:S-DNA-T family DNA segregation ATPase FtsK/SpoIIIE
MAASNPFQRELCAVALLGAGVFLGVSLATYSPSDPVTGSLGPLAAVYRPDQLEYPAPEEIVNSCGRWGALAADLLLTGFGAGAYYTVGSILVLSGFLFLRASLEGPLLRFAGWLGSLVGVSTLAALTLPEWSPGPMVGAGGYLGALGAGLLLHHFALFGSLLLAGSIVVGGLMLSSDQVFPAILRWTLGGFLTPFLRRPETALARVDAGSPQRTPNKSPPVKIAPTRSKREKAAAASSDDANAVLVGRATAGMAGTAVGAAGPLAIGKSRQTGAASSRHDEDSSPSILPIRGRGKNVADRNAGDVADLDADDGADSDGGGGDYGMSQAASASNAGAGRGAARGSMRDAGRSGTRPTDRKADPKSSDRPADRKAADRSLKHDGQGEREGEGAIETEDAAATGTANAAPGPHFKSRSTHDARSSVLAELQEDERAAAVDDYELPGIDLLVAGEDIDWESQEKEVRRKAKVLEKTFADFGFQVRVVEIETGPVIAQYEVELEAGLRLSKITALADDLAIALRVPSVRIVAPIPGKNTVGIEVPNEERQVVRLREVIEETNGKIKKMRIPLFLGKDVSGNPLAVDLSTLPHLLIAGRTGTGKSVCLNAIISSILMTRRPDEVRMIMIDPKMVELSGYGRLPHLMHPVVTDMKKAEAILAWGVEKMEERYALLARAGVRHISNYNQLGEEELRRRLQPEDDAAWASIPKQLPFIVIVADEIADMMMTAGKEVEQHIIRLAQKSRAVGIHLILATQKPTVDVITGLIKSNLPARISFQVASRVDSRVVLDEMGADKLLGNGDMLFLWPGTSTLLRGQGTYLGDDEITRLVDCCSRGRQQNFVSELVNMKVEGTDDGDGGLMEKLRKRDELYESAIDVVIREGRGSCSLLQRALGIGYGRAARLIDFMAEDGIVGTYAGSQAREVLMTVDQWEQLQSDPSSSVPEATTGSRDRGGGPVSPTRLAGTNSGANSGATGGKSSGAGGSMGQPSPRSASGNAMAATGTTGPTPASHAKEAPTAIGPSGRHVSNATAVVAAAAREPSRSASPAGVAPSVAFAPPSELDEFLPDSFTGSDGASHLASGNGAALAPAFAAEAGIPPRVPLAGNLPPTVALNGTAASPTALRLELSDEPGNDEDPHDELSDGPDQHADKRPDLRLDQRLDRRPDKRLQALPTEDGTGYDNELADANGEHSLREDFGDDNLGGDENLGGEDFASDDFGGEDFGGEDFGGEDAIPDAMVGVGQGQRPSAAAAAPPPTANAGERRAQSAGLSQAAQGGLRASTSAAINVASSPADIPAANEPAAAGSPPAENRVRTGSNRRGVITFPRLMNSEGE